MKNKTAKKLTEALNIHAEALNDHTQAIEELEWRLGVFPIEEFDELTAAINKAEIPSSVTRLIEAAREIVSREEPCGIDANEMPC